MPPSRVDTPNFRVLQIIEVAPEVTTSSTDEEELGNAGQRPEAVAPRAPSRPSSAEPQLPADPRIMAMLRAPISRREYKFTGQYIYVDYESFMRSVNPNWVPPLWLAAQETCEELTQEPCRHPSSFLYTSTSNRHGPVSWSQRMSKWLDELPVANGNIEAAQCSSYKLQGHRVCRGAEDSRSPNGTLAGPLRPRAQSTPIPFSISSNHLMEHHEYRPGQSNSTVPTAPAAGPTTNLSGGSVAPGLHHPNPLGQHPVVIRELPIQLRIPKRKSSLRNNFQRSHDNIQPPAPSTTLAGDNRILDTHSIELDIEHRDTAADPQVDPQIGQGRRSSVVSPQLLSRLRGRRNSNPHPPLRFQLDAQLPNSTLQPQLDLELDQDTFMGDSPPHIYNNTTDVHDLAVQRRFSAHVHQFFGQDSGKVNHKKHARSEVRILVP